VGPGARAVFDRCCTPNTAHGHPYIDTFPVNWDSQPTAETASSGSKVHAGSEAEMTRDSPVLACAVGCNGYAAKSSDEVHVVASPPSRVTIRYKRTSQRGCTIVCFFDLVFDADISQLYLLLCFLLSRNISCLSLLGVCTRRQVGRLAARLLLFAGGPNVGEWADGLNSDSFKAVLE
jgi:hypothetical protein